MGNHEYYGELFADLAEKGFITASIVGDGSVQSPPGSIENRARRLLCAAEALLDDNVNWAGSGRLSGRYALTGHSNGGFGAFVAAVTVLENPDLLAENELVSVATIAPNRIVAQYDLVIGSNSPAYFVIQGTGDGDTIGAAPSHYDSVIPQKNGAEVLSAERKVFIWAYDVEHNEFGGRMNICNSSAKGRALARAYFNGFLIGVFYEDPVALDLFFATGQATPDIHNDIKNADFWTDFGGEPQVYGTSSQRVDPDTGFRGRIIDSFENGDPMLSDAGLAVTASNPTMVHEIDVAGSFDALHLANAARVDWEDGDEIRWELDLAMREALAGATSLVFRAGSVASIVNQDIMTCSGTAGSLPNIVLVVSDGINPEIELSLEPYGRLTLPETRWERNCLLGAMSCHNWDLLQTTFRVPVGLLCSPEDGVYLSEIQEIGLRFEGQGDPPRIMLLDDLEIRSVPGEPDVPATCRCPSDGETAGTDTDDTGGTTAGPTTDSDTESDSATTTTGGGGDGCACRVDIRGTPIAFGLFVGVFGWIIRKRRVAPVA